MESYDKQVPPTVDASVPAKIMEEICSVLHDAQFGLTEDAIMAVVAMRRYRAISCALEDLVLMGELDARRRPDVSEEAAPSIHDYVFWRPCEEEQAERRKPQPRQAFLSRVFFAPLNLVNWISRLLT